MDVLSIIDITKINTDNFKKKEIITDSNNDNEVNKDENNKDVKKEINKKNSSNVANDSVFFYDKNAKLLIEIYNEGIKIFNKKATILKKEVGIILPKENVINVAIDKKLNYLLCLRTKQVNEIKLELVLIDLTSEIGLGVIEENFDYLLGMFFIGKKTLFLSADSNDNNLFEFCFVFVDKISFYEIEKKSKNNKEKVKNLSTVNINDNTLIKDYSFNYKFKILCIQKTDLSFNFYNLSNRKYFNQPFNIEIPFIENLRFNLLSSGTFIKVNEQQKKDVKENFDSIIRYTNSQFFLESIYNDLYFICLCYEDRKIYIYELDTLNEMKEKFSISYERHNNCSSLLVYDNLIIVLNFVLKKLVIIDIKYKQLIVSMTKTCKLPAIKNLFINGEILEERRDTTKVNTVRLYGGNLYKVSFNRDNFVTLFEQMRTNVLEKKIEIKRIEEENHIKIVNNMVQISYYDILINLLHRKGTNDLILKLLYKIILKKEKSTRVIKFLKDLGNQIKDVNKGILNNQDINNSGSKKSSETSSSKILRFASSSINERKHCIKENEILIDVFQKFINISDSLLNENKIEESDDFCNYIIFYLTQMARIFRQRNISLTTNYYNIINLFITRIKNTSLLLPFLNCRNIPDNIETAEYLLELAKDKNDINRTSFEQYGLNILKRLKKPEAMFNFYFKTKSISEVMYLFKESPLALTASQIREIITNNIQFFEKNRTVLKTFFEDN